VGRIRYLGVVLYDADRVREAASVDDPRQLYEAQLSLFLDPEDPSVRRHAEQAGIPDPWIEAACRSPVWQLAVAFRVALPLHPEYRTLPMVWYVPPMSPVLGNLPEGTDAAAAIDLVERLRIPIRYLANLLAAGDETVVRQVLRRLVAMSLYQRAKLLGEDFDEELLLGAGLTPESAEAMARLLGVARYEERFVLPTAPRPTASARAQGEAGFDRLADRCPVEEVRP